MALRPVLRPLLALANATDRPPTGQSVAQRRRVSARSPLTMRYVTDPGRHQVDTQDHQVSVPGGEIGVRTYRTPGSWATPAHLYLHGGMYWLGSVAEYDPICSWYAGVTGAMIVSVDYRLAPEHPYPTAVEDAYAALAWLSDQANSLGVDPARISVGGFSAGGGLAAAVALMARDRSGPAIVLQALESPMLDLRLLSDSMAELGQGHVLTRAALAEAVGFYLPTPAQVSEPYASPLLAPDLTGLPPAYVLSCECDPLRDEAESYAARLRAAGVPTELHRVLGHLHGSIFMTRLLPSARQAVATTTAALRAAYGLSPR